MKNLIKELVDVFAFEETSSKLVLESSYDQQFRRYRRFKFLKEKLLRQYKLTQKTQTYAKVLSSLKGTITLEIYERQKLKLLEILGSRSKHLFRIRSGKLNPLTRQPKFICFLVKLIEFYKYIQKF